MATAAGPFGAPETSVALRPVGAVGHRLMLQLLAPEPLARARTAADNVVTTVMATRAWDRALVEAAWSALTHLAGPNAPVRMGVGAEAHGATVVGMRLYLDLFCAGASQADAALGTVCAATGQPSPLAALGDGVPSPRILGIDITPGQPAKLKAYAAAAAVGRGHLRRLLARVGREGDAVIDAVDAALGRDALTARSSLVAVDTNGNKAKVDLSLPDHVSDDAAAGRAVEEMLGALGRPIDPYRAAAREALEGVSADRSAGVHQHLGIRPMAGGAQVAVYFRARSSGAAWVPARSRPRVLLTAR